MQLKVNPVILVQFMILFMDFLYSESLSRQKLNVSASLRHKTTFNYHVDSNYNLPNNDIANYFYTDIRLPQERSEGKSPRKIRRSISSTDNTGNGLLQNVDTKIDPVLSTRLKNDLSSELSMDHELQNALLNLDKDKYDTFISNHKSMIASNDKNILHNILKSTNNTMFDELGLTRDLISHPLYPEGDPQQKLGSGRQHKLRRKLLEALSKRIEARNLLMHEKALLRQRMLQDRLEQARDRDNYFHEISRIPVSNSEVSGSFSNPAVRKSNFLDDNNEPHTDNNGYYIHHLQELLGRQNLLTMVNHGDNGVDDLNRSPELEVQHHIPFEEQTARYDELSPKDEFNRRGDISRNMKQHKDKYQTGTLDIDNVNINFQPTSTQDHSLFENRDDSYLTTRNLIKNIGNLGDETLPYGSLGSSKQKYLKSNVVDQDVYGSKFTSNDALLEQSSIPKEKKTWVTDVNVYSKKKSNDLIDLFGDDDNDDDNEAMDEYDPCEKKPCLNHGTCKIAGDARYVCICPRKFRGKHCERKDYCRPNPCTHASKCTEIDGGFRCSCKAGFKGTQCQERNYCMPNPCGINGYCTVSSNSDGFACSCKQGYTGRFCDNTLYDPANATGIKEIKHTLIADVKSLILSPTVHVNLQEERAACASFPCLNDGACVHDTSTSYGFKCNCRDDFSGEICEEKSCYCKNGGTCVGEGIEMKCLCRGGYGGNKCQEHTQCNEDTCLNGGICIEEVGGFKCNCDSGYKGLRCQDEIRCKPNPCFHGGICKDYGTFYQCQCQRGFKGKHCEDLDLCEPNPCQNEGRCFDYADGYQCECKSGYSGKDCAGKVSGLG